MLIRKIKNSIKSIDLIFILILLPIVLALVSTIVEDVYSDKHWDKVTESIDNGYMVYVNGAEIDPENINIEDYPEEYIHVDDDNRKILISSIEGN